MSKQAPGPLPSTKASVPPARLPALFPGRSAGGVSPQGRSLSPQPLPAAQARSPARDHLHLTPDSHGSPNGAGGGGSHSPLAHPKLEPLQVTHAAHQSSNSSPGSGETKEKEKSPTQSKGQILAPLDEGKANHASSGTAPGESSPSTGPPSVTPTVAPVAALPLPPTLSPAEIAAMEGLFKASDMYLVTQSPCEGVSTRVSIRASTAVVSPSRMHALMQVNIYNSYDREGTTDWTPHIVFRRYPRLTIVHDQWGPRYEMNEWGRGGQYGKTGIHWATPAATEGNSKGAHGHGELPAVKDKSGGTSSAESGTGGEDAPPFVMPLFDRLEAMDNDAEKPTKIHIDFPTVSGKGKK